MKKIKSIVDGYRKNNYEAYFPDYINIPSPVSGRMHCRSGSRVHTHTIIYQLNDSPSAKSLYEMLPLDTEVENFGNNEKIFYAFDPYSGLYILGEAVEGVDQIKDLSGTIHVEAVD